MASRAAWRASSSTRSASSARIASVHTICVAKLSSRYAGMSPPASNASSLADSASQADRGTMRGSSLTCRSARNRPASSSVRRRARRLFTVSTNVPARAGRRYPAMTVQDRKAVRPAWAPAASMARAAAKEGQAVGYRERRGLFASGRVKTAESGQVFPMDLHVGRGVPQNTRPSAKTSTRPPAIRQPRRIGSLLRRMRAHIGFHDRPGRGCVRRRAAPPAARALAGTAARPARPAPRPATRPYRSCRSWHRRSQPDPNEAAQLMTQEHDARQGGRIAQAVDLPDQPLRQRHRAQPEQSHPGGEDVQHPRRQRQPEQQQDTEGAHAVDHGEQALRCTCRPACRHRTNPAR